MSYFKKVHLIPEDKLKSMQECALLKRESVDRILRISLLLARVNGYNDLLQVRTKNGNFMVDSNILDLIEKLEDEESLLKGEEDFIVLLKEANVPLVLIKNENIKSKLSDLYSDELNKLQPVSRQQTNENVGEITAKRDPKAVIPVESTSSIQSTPSLPDPRWNYSDYFVSQPSKRKKRKSRDDWIWRPM